jgi:hypothetical protein
MVLSWYDHGMIMVLSWYYHGIIMVWSWYDHGMIMVWSWYYHGMIMVLSWYDHGIIKVFCSFCRQLCKGFMATRLIWIVNFNYNLSFHKKCDRNKKVGKTASLYYVCHLWLLFMECDLKILRIRKAIVFFPCLNECRAQMCFIFKASIWSFHRRLIQAMFRPIPSFHCLLVRLLSQITTLYPARR